MRWVDVHNTIEWDVLLASLGGHPLQSALWGEAKKKIYGITDQRLALYHQDKLICLIRIENRGLKSFLKVAWIPQGPTFFSDTEWKEIENDVLTQLKKYGISLCIFSPWKKVIEPCQTKGLRKTIWIDMQKGKEKLWMALDKQWRYGVRCAQRFDVQVISTIAQNDVSQFYQLCISLSNNKQFRFQYKQSFLEYLLYNSNENGVEAKLFIAKINNTIIAGSFVLRIGKTCHYLFGALDRSYAKYRAGEYLQWSVIVWASEKNCVLYDLEGIDEIKNPGVAAFKKKMGGDSVYLQKAEILNLNRRAKILSKLVSRKIACT